MAVPNRSTLTSRYLQVVAGIQKHIAASIVLGGTSYTPADLVKTFQSWQTAVVALAHAKAEYHAAVEAEQALTKICQQLWLLLEAYARLLYGSDPVALGDFGYIPETRAKESPTTLVAAAAKARATRAARHTMGPDQKAKITGATSAPATVAPQVVPTVVTK